MKTKQYWLLLLHCLILIVAGVSCSEMNDLHQPYLDKGETIYAAKPDSVSFRGGDNRALLEVFIKSQRVDKVRIYWNSYADSADLAVENKTGKLTRLLENLEEKSYTMNLVSFDKFGNRSLPFEAIGTVYGDIYRSGLLSTTITAMAYTTEDTLKLTLSGTNENILGYEMRYTPLGSSSEVLLNVDGVKRLKWLSSSECKLGAKVDPQRMLKWRTAYIPDTTAIDTFYTQWSEYQPPLISQMKRLFKSSEHIR